jgi:hypothetical protein
MILKASNLYVKEGSFNEFAERAVDTICSYRCKTEMELKNLGSGYRTNRSLFRRGKLESNSCKGYL